MWWTACSARPADHDTPAGRARRQRAMNPPPRCGHRNTQRRHLSRAFMPRRWRDRAMITGLRGATIWSEDLSNLLPFYRDVLGLPVAVETPGFVVLGRREGPSLALGTHSEVHGRNA